MNQHQHVISFLLHQPPRLTKRTSVPRPKSTRVASDICPDLTSFLSTAQLSSQGATYILQISLVKPVGNLINVQASWHRWILWLPSMATARTGQFRLNDFQEQFWSNYLCFLVLWYPLKDCRWRLLWIWYKTAKLLLPNGAHIFLVLHIGKQNLIHIPGTFKIYLNWNSKAFSNMMKISEIWQKFLQDSSRFVIVPLSPTIHI